MYYYSLDYLLLQVVTNRGGKGVNRGTRTKGEGRKIGGGARSKNAKITPEMQAQALRLDEEMAAALRAMESSPPPHPVLSTASSTTVSSTTAPINAVPTSSSITPSVTSSESLQLHQPLVKCIFFVCF